MRKNSPVKTFYLRERGLGCCLTSCVQCTRRNRSKEGKGLTQGHPDQVRSRPPIRGSQSRPLVERQLLWAHVGGRGRGSSWAQNSGEEPAIASVQGGCKGFSLLQLLFPAACLRVLSGSPSRTLTSSRRKTVMASCYLGSGKSQM